MLILYLVLYLKGFPGGAVVKNLPANARDARDPLEKEMATPSNILAWRTTMDRGAWWATVLGVAELDTTKRACTHGLRKEA